MQVGEQIIQGDVILELVSELPATAIKQEIEARKGRLVLQESEVTGHFHHFMPDADVALYEDTSAISKNKTVTQDRGLYLEVKVPTKLYHGKGYDDKPQINRTGDHEAMPVPPGTYQVRIVQVWDYESTEARPVRD